MNEESIHQLEPLEELLSRPTAEVIELHAQAGG